MGVTLDARQWVQKYADFLYSYALARLDDEDVSRDLVQDTFLAALERLDQFKGQSSERTWLTAILKYKIIDVYRRRNSGLQTGHIGHEPERELFEADNGHWRDIYAPRHFSFDNADENIVRKELTAILQKCLKKLPALWYAIFSMKHLDEKTTELICKELKVTPGNFWVIIHRAKLNLRACIQKEDEL